MVIYDRTTLSHKCDARSITIVTLQKLWFNFVKLKIFRNKFMFIVYQRKLQKISQWWSDKHLNIDESLIASCATLRMEIEFYLVSFRTILGLRLSMKSKSKDEGFLGLVYIRQKIEKHIYNLYRHNFLCLSA